MPKILIGIGSCEAYEAKGNNDAMRKTWLSDAASLGIDYRFFHGNGATPKDDVVVVPCDDGYLGLMQKDKLMYTWSVAQGYEFTFRCDHDSYCRPERLIISGFEDYDIAGCMGPYRTIEGGPGFFISKEACQIYIDEIETASKGMFIKGNWSETNYYKSYLNDWWESALVEKHGLPKGGSSGFVHLTSLTDAGPRRDNNIMAAHLSPVIPEGYVNVGGREPEHRYRPEFMLQKHQEWLDSTGTCSDVANFIPF